MKMRKLFLLPFVLFALTSCDNKEEPITPKYTVTWVVEGTTVETDVDVLEGATPEYNGTTPTKTSTESTVYTFSGWSPEVTTVTTDATYTAVFSEATRQYTISFVDEEGGLIESASYDYGTSADDVVVPEKTVEAEDAEYIDHYVTLLDEAITEVTTDASYTISFVAVATKEGCTAVALNIAATWSGTNASDAYWDTYGIILTGANFGANLTLEQLMGYTPTAFLPEPYFTVVSDFEYSEQYNNYNASYVSTSLGVFVYVVVFNNGTTDTPKNTIQFQVSPISFGA